ncbi:hypothetical protein BZZ01_13070 [Nostocales cyanobacterium HT-58-2]|nr:hypothetical protein BZZ01_13070 [Nostocales cyanobacterium HT-58-2]
MTSVNVVVQSVCKPFSRSMQSLFIASASQPTQSSQPNLVDQTDHSISFLVAFFLTFVFIGFVLGCFLQHKRYQKLRAKRQAKILQEVETLEKIWKMKP